MPSETLPSSPVDPQAASKLAIRVRDSLAWIAAIGCRGFDCSEKSLAILANWGRPTPVPSENLEAVRTDLGDCRRCPLSSARRHIVFGEGSPRARLMFVGEGPGRDEDRTGRPFVGPAGQLLTRIIAAIGFTRDQVYIANVIKCRPPGNRTPQPAEIAACAPFLKRQIRAVAPDFICTLGSVAAQFLLSVQTPISRLRGRFHHYEDVPVMPTFHPAYLLRNPEQKRAVWEDMKTLMRAMDKAGIVRPGADGDGTG